jgi:glycosyltransferase involved in cell wall biosynthesis
MTPVRSRPVRVLELISGLALESVSGGVARFVTELAQAFDPQRVQASIAAIWDYGTPFEGPRAAALTEAGIPTVVAAPWDESGAYRSCVAGLAGLRRELRDTVDIAHSHGEFSDLAAIAVRRQVGARHLVRTVHNEREWGKRPLWGKLFPNFVYPWFFGADLAVSQRAADNLDRRPLARALGKSALYIPNALNFERFTQVRVDRRQKRESLGLPSDAFVVGSVGRLVPQKGYDTLLAAIPAVLAECPRARFVLVGAGAQREALVEQARALGVADALTLTGARPDVAELLRTFDLFVSPSRYEGLPTVVLEAIASGAPVVATRVSGNSELIEDGVSGLLVPPEDPPALAQAILRMANGAAPAAEMAARALERARASYSLDSVAARYADFYESLMGERGTART